MVEIQCNRSLTKTISIGTDQVLGLPKDVLYDPSLTLVVSEPCQSAILKRVVGLPWMQAEWLVWPQPWSSFILRNWNSLQP